jgi:hypothetical protein
MLGGSEQEADVCIFCRQQANKQTSAVSECLYYGSNNDPHHPECLQTCPFQWRAVLLRPAQNCRSTVTTS